MIVLYSKFFKPLTLSVKRFRNVLFLKYYIHSTNLANDTYKINEINELKNDINLLKMKRNLLYIRNQFIPRSKHFPPQL